MILESARIPKGTRWNTETVQEPELTVAQLPPLLGQWIKVGKRWLSGSEQIFLLVVVTLPLKDPIPLGNLTEKNRE